MYYKILVKRFVKPANQKSYKVMSKLQVWGSCTSEIMFFNCMNSMFNMNKKDLKNVTLTFNGNNATHFYTTNNGERIKEYYILVEE